MESQSQLISYEDLTARFERIRDTTVAVFIDFGRKDLGLQPTTHPKYGVRDSLIYRSGAVIYHATLLRDQILTLEKQINEQFPEDTTPMMLRAANQASFLFDDLVFNVCSLYDYVGCMIGYLYGGGARTDKKWNSIIRPIRDGHMTFPDPDIGKALLHYDKVLVDQLFRYRSDLIHNKRDGSDVQVQTRLAEDGAVSMLSIGCPARLRKRVKLFRRIKNIDDIGLVGSSLVLADSALSQVEELLGTVCRDLVPRTKSRIQTMVEKRLGSETNDNETHP